MKLARFIFFVFSMAGLAWADLASIKEDPAADKRAIRALDHAGKMLSNIRDNFAKTSLTGLKEQLAEFSASMELTVDSLAATGKSPAKSPNLFKKTEMQLRLYIRKLKTLEHDLNVEERPLITPVITRLEEIQDNLVQGIMKKK